MAHRGLTRDLIMQKAISLINDSGYKNISFTAISESFQVKPPAMFKHFKNLEELKESLTLYGIKKLKQNLQNSVIGESAEPALRALCKAYRNFARTNSGLYLAIQPSYFNSNKEIEREAIALMEIIIRVIKGFSIAAENIIHLLRIVRSSLHGFVVLEIEFGFGMPGNIDISFDHQVDALIAMVKTFSNTAN